MPDPRLDSPRLAVLAVLPFGCIHYLAIQEYAHAAALVNKLMSMTLQVIGGLIIVWAVNDNLGLFKNHSILLSIADWLRDFLIRKSVIAVHLSGGSSSQVSVSSAGAIDLAPSTTEERIAYLERAIVELRSDLRNGLTIAQSQLSEARAELGASIESTRGQITVLNSRVERATVGGFKAQIFGVLLAVYGAITSVFA